MGFGHNGFASHDNVHEELVSIEGVIGSVFGDILFGNSVANKIYGGAGQDFIQGYNGNDLLSGGPDNDIIQGGGGVDRAVFAGTLSSYTISLAPNSQATVYGVDGSDTLSYIERLMFDDMSLAIDLNGNAGIVAKILGSVLGKSGVSSPEYFGIGLHYLDGGISYETLAELAIYTVLGNAASNQSVVNLLYRNVFGEDPMLAGAAPYIAMLDSKTMSVGELGALLADNEANTQNIDLVGLSNTGVTYLEYIV
jgi:hypothetical protein